MEIRIDRIMSKTFVQDICPRHLSKTFVQDICPRRLSKTFVQDICPRHLTYNCYVVKNLWNSYLFLLESFLNLGEILVSNGSRAVPKGAWRCCKSFGTIWDQFSSTFTHYNSTFSWKIKAAILSKWRFLVIFSESFLPLFRRNSASKCMKRGAKQRLAVL